MGSKDKARAAFYEAAEKAGVSLVGEYTGARSPVSCICSKGHACSPSPANIGQGHSWCLTCSYEERAKKRSARAKDRFLELAYMSGAVVVGEYVDTHTPVECVCARGHECSPMPVNILKGQGWCSSCCGRVSPKIAGALLKAKALEDGVILLGEYNGSHSYIDAVCPRGHEFRAFPASVLRGHWWCNQCKSNFDRLYLVSGEFYGKMWAKYGIASGIMRLSYHRRNGWSLYREWSGLDHSIVWRVESYVRNVHRKLKWPSLESYLLPQGGYSETFPFEHIGYVEDIIDEQIRG